MPRREIHYRETEINTREPPPRRASSPVLFARPWPFAAVNAKKSLTPASIIDGMGIHQRQVQRISNKFGEQFRTTTGEWKSETSFLGQKANTLRWPQ
jgi:hypothetical protein